MLNIIHVHLNDMSEEVTIDVAYMDEGQSLKEFEEFDVDISGQTLRYKIIAKNMKIFTILYNTGKGVEEIPFEEIRINKNDFVSITKSELSSEPLFAQIQHVPICMISTPNKDKLSGLLQDRVKNNMIGFCIGRSFERLPGFIDL